jgi:hypothetical protein
MMISICTRKTTGTFSDDPQTYKLDSIAGIMLLDRELNIYPRIQRTTF